MQEFIVRYARLRPPRAAPEALAPDWAAITCSRSPHGDEEFHLCWLADASDCLGWEDFDTLQAALDLAATAAGLSPLEWRECRVAVGGAEGRIPWSLVAPLVESPEARRGSPGDHSG